MSPGSFRLADCVVRPSEHIIERGGETVHVEPRTMWLLTLLAEHPGEVVGRDAIEARLWQGRVVGYDALTQVVAKLRKALGDDAHAPRYLLTIPKEGYQLIAAITPVDACGAEIHRDMVPPATDAPEQEAHEFPNGTQAIRTSSPSRRLPGAMLLLVIGALLGLVWWLAPSQVGRATQTSAPGNRPSIVVMPFENKNSDASDHYLAEGLTEDLTAALTHFPELFVIARHSALCKAFHKADYAKYPIMESSRRMLDQVVGGERIGSG